MYKDLGSIIRSQVWWMNKISIGINVHNLSIQNVKLIFYIDYNSDYNERLK